MRTYKEQTALILEKVNQYNNAKKKRMRYIYSLSTAAACLLVILSIYASLPMILKNHIDTPIIPTEPTPTEPYNDVIDDNAHGGGGPGDCIHYDSDAWFSESYHSIDLLFIRFIYPKDFEKWIEEASRLSEEYATEQCKSRYFTMDFFIQYFDIKREDFEKLYYNTNLYSMYDYNIDILYSGDKDKIEQYYSKITPERIAEMKSRAELRNEKDALVKKTFGDIVVNGETVAKEYEAWIRSLDKNNIIEWLDENVHGETGWFLAANSLWSIDEFINYWSDKEVSRYSINDLAPAPPAFDDVPAEIIETE